MCLHDKLTQNAAWKLRATAAQVTSSEFNDFLNIVNHRPRKRAASYKVSWKCMKLTLFLCHKSNAHWSQAWFERVRSLATFQCFQMWGNCKTSQQFIVCIQRSKCPQPMKRREVQIFIFMCCDSVWWHKIRHKKVYNEIQYTKILAL